MPCMGPPHPDEEQVDKVYNDVLELLDTKHNIRFGEDNDFTTPKMKQSRESALWFLRESIREVLDQHICEHW